MPYKTCPDPKYAPPFRSVDMGRKAELDVTQTALTSARTTANSIYCPPLLQCQLDLQSGAVNADDKDYKTAYSYFFEAFEGFTQTDDKDPRALKALKYMMLCKVMMNLVSERSWSASPHDLLTRFGCTDALTQPDDIPPLLLLKSARQFEGKDLQAMSATATALKERSLDLFKTALKEYQERECFACGRWSALRMNWISRTPTRSPDTIPPLHLVRHATGAESRPCDRAVLLGGVVLGRTRSRTAAAGGRGEVSVFKRLGTTALLHIETTPGLFHLDRSNVVMAITWVP